MSARSTRKKRQRRLVDAKRRKRAQATLVNLGAEDTFEAEWWTDGDSRFGRIRGARIDVLILDDIVGEVPK